MDSKQVIVDIFSQPLEARLAKLRLDTAGIDSEILDENIVAVQPLYSTAVGGVKLVVSRSDENEARNILKKYRDEQMKYEATIESQCPVCKSENINRNISSRILFVFLCILTAGLIWLLFYRKHKCNDCGHVW